MPNQLTPANRDRALAFVLANARPLDQALCRHHLLGGNRAAVLAELAGLQNADGGFHGMEADFQGTASSVLCTLRALEILEELEAPASDPMAARAVAYLLAAYVPEWRSWPLVPRHDNSLPHAPWWNWSDDFEEGWGFFADNPRPSVVAALHVFDSGSSMRRSSTRVTEVCGAAVPRNWSRPVSRRTRSSAIMRFATTPAVPQGGA